MAYREPGVKVSQEFVNALPALATFALPNVSVGPAFQVVKQSLAGTYSAQAADFSYPGQILGSYIDTRAADSTDLLSFPVSVYLQNMVVRYLSLAAAGTVASANLNNISASAANVFANVQVGDVIVVTGSANGNNGAYTVRAVTDNNNLQTNETFAAAESSLSFTIRRNMQATAGLVQIPTSTTGVAVSSTGVHLPLGLTYSDSVLGSGLPIMAANVLISYRALRIEKSADVAPYTTTSDLQADFGLDQIVPENPVVFAAFLALNNSSTETNILALSQDYLTDELLAYSHAFDVLSLTDMYAVSVLTQNTSVHTSLKAHVDSMSVDTVKKERVGIINRQLVTSSVVVDYSATGAAEGLATTGILTQAAALFITDGVVPGMFAHITAPTSAVGRYQIGAVLSQTKLQLVGAPAVTANSLTFAIEKDLTKNDQANVMAAYAASIGDRRLVMTWPDVVKIPVGATIRQLPGYFLNPCIGALTTGLPTQQGFTNLSVSVYQGVVHSTKYFTSAQLNLLAAGGVMIFVQDVLDQTALYIRHQLTTDTSAIKFQEYSITKNVDFIAKFIRDNHKAFIGKYNIVDTTFDDLKSNAQGIINYLKDSTKRPKIGGVIRSGKLTSIVQDAANIDTITERWSLDIPIPLNNLDITVVV